MFRRAYRSFLGQLMLAFLVVGIGSFSLNVALTVLAGRGSLEQLVEENLDALARSALDEVQARFLHVANELKLWAELDVLEEILIEDRSMRIENLLIALQHDHAADYASLSVVDQNRVVLASSSIERIGETWSLPLPNETEDLPSLGRIPAVTDEGEEVFAAMQPIRTRVRTEPIGWLVASVHVAPLREIVAGLTGEEGAVKFVLLFDPEDRLLAGRPPGLPQGEIPGAVLGMAGVRGARRIDLGSQGEYLTATRLRGGPGARSLRAVAFWRAWEAHRTTRNFMVAAVGAGLLGLTLAIGASFLIARRLTGPLGTITEATTRLASGDRTYRVPEEAASDEVAQLARSFNTMAERLADAVSSLEASTARWRAIVTHAPDIVMTISCDGTILSINRTAPGYDIEEVTGSKVTSYLTSRHGGAFDEALRRVFETGESRELEIETSGVDVPVSWYSLRLGPIRQGGRLVAAACIATDITERRRLEQEILRVSEEERARIGQDLHDGLGQVLTGTAMLVRGLRQKLDEGGRAADAAEARQIGTLINDAVEQTRTLARGLFPIGLDQGGLQAALEELAATIGGVPGVTCHVEVCGSALAVDRPGAMHLFRIVQETVNNALKHGKAANIWIRTVDDGERRGITVLDDGVGIDARARSADGMGLHLMEYRARVINALLEVRRRPEGGTEVSCWL